MLQIGHVLVCGCLRMINMVVQEGPGSGRLLANIAFLGRCGETHIQRRLEILHADRWIMDVRDPVSMGLAWRGHRAPPDPIQPVMVKAVG